MYQFCFLFHILARNVDAKTPYETRFGGDFRGPIIPFGCHVQYLPSRPDDKRRCHPFGEKFLHGLFIGYVQHEGGGWCHEEVLVIDWFEIENADQVFQIHPRKCHAEEVYPVKINNKFIFPAADVVLQQPDEPIPEKKMRLTKKVRLKQLQECRERQAKEDEEEKENQRQQENMQDQHSEDYWTSTRDSLIRHHKTPRTQLFIPTEESSPIPLKYLDIHRSTDTSLNTLAEKYITD